jgi:uncharacterized membrane protein
MTPAELLAQRIAALKADADLATALATVAQTMSRASGVVLAPATSGTPNARQVTFVFELQPYAIKDAEAFLAAVKKLQTLTA